MRPSSGLICSWMGLWLKSSGPVPCSSRWIQLGQEGLCSAATASRAARATARARNRVLRRSWVLTTRTGVTSLLRRSRPTIRKPIRS
ncbi:unnamed protein product [Symbiodinium microadriaticum]|nr:unnamed protein product [Symbiodinium microadriaticum]CAE7936331.1 unnamed protein product [Symbiodinium sp. KB8]